MISGSEINISVLKLLSFETLAIALRVSILEKLVSKIKARYRFWKIWSRKKVLVTVSEKSNGFGKFGLEKSLGFGFGPFALSISDPMAELFLLNFV